MWAAILCVCVCNGGVVSFVVWEAIVFVLVMVRLIGLCCVCGRCAVIVIGMMVGFGYLGGCYFVSVVVVMVSRGVVFMDFSLLHFDDVIGGVARFRLIFCLGDDEGRRG